MMAKVRFNVSRAISDLTRDINKALKDKALQEDMGVFLTERIRFEARKGKPLNDDRKFPELKPSSKGIRGHLSKRNPTHAAFEATRSNLTFTGQLQNAVAFKKLKTGVFQLFVKPSARKALVKKDGSAIRSPNNEKVDKDLRKRGFTLFTAKGLKSDKKIPRRLRQILLRFLRRKLKS